jgi:hypothetical protein
MSASPSDLDALLQSVLNEEESGPTEEEVQAMLSDPAFAALIDRSLKRYEGILSEQGADQARRTVAYVFLTDPASAALLAKIRERGPLDPSAMAKKPGAPSSDTARGKRRSRRSRP